MAKTRALGELTAFDQAVSHLEPNKASALSEARQKSPHLANDPTLKKMFLHANEQDAKAAAKQYAAYWTNRVKLFREKAFEPMSQALRDDAEALSYGHIRTIPDNDQVLVMDLSRIPKKYDFESLARATTHMMLDAIQRSKRMQEEGVMFVVDVGNIRHFDHQWMKLARCMGKDAFPAKTAGYCVANLSPAATKWTKRLLMPILGKEEREVFKMASSPEELKDCIGVDCLA